MLSRLSHGWRIFAKTSGQRLEVRRKRHKSGNSSTQFFSILGLGFLALVGFSPPTMASEIQGAKDPIDTVAESFEAMMLQQLYAQMQKSNRVLNVGEDNPFAPSSAELIFREMQDQQMLQGVAQRRPLGVADMVARQLRGTGGVGPSRLLESEQDNRNRE